MLVHIEVEELEAEEQQFEAQVGAVETVTNFSDAKSDNVSSKRRVKGVAVCDSVNDKVKSEDGQISYPVSLVEIGVWSPTPLLEMLAMTLESCNVKLPLPGV